MAADDRPINWRLKVTGTAQTSQKMGAVADKMQTLEERSRIAATKFTGVASASSAMGTILSQVNPQIGSFAAILGTSGGAASGLVTAMGGPTGLAIGGLIAVLGLAVTWFRQSKEEARQFHDELTHGTKVAAEYVNTVARLEREQAKAARSAMNVTTAKDFTEELDKQYKLKEKDRRQLELIRGNIESMTEEDKAYMIGVPPAGTLAWRRTEMAQEGIIDARTRAIAQLKENLNLTRELNNELDVHEEITADIIERQTKAKKEGTGVGAVLDASTDRSDMLLMDPDAIIDPWTIAVKEIKEETADLTKTLVAQSNEVEQAWFHAASVGPSAMVNALYELAKGHELNAAAMIESIGDTLWSSGWAHVLQAAAIAWVPGMQGNAVGLATAGGVEMAAGLVMGAAGARAGGGAEAGGGTARPIKEHDPREYQGGGGTTVINVHTLRPDKASGEAIYASMDAAYRKRGPGVVRP